MFQEQNVLVLRLGFRGLAREVQRLHDSIGVFLRRDFQSNPKILFDFSHGGELRDHRPLFSPLNRRSCCTDMSYRLALSSAWALSRSLSGDLASSSAIVSLGRSGPARRYSAAPEPASPEVGIQVPVLCSTDPPDEVESSQVPSVEEVRARVFGRPAEPPASAPRAGARKPRTGREILSRPLEGFDLVNWYPQSFIRLDPLWEDPSEKL